MFKINLMTCIFAFYHLLSKNYKYTSTQASEASLCWSICSFFPVEKSKKIYSPPLGQFFKLPVQGNFWGSSHGFLMFELRLSIEIRRKIVRDFFEKIFFFSKKLFFLLWRDKHFCLLHLWSISPPSWFFFQFFQNFLNF